MCKSPLLVAPSMPTEPDKWPASSLPERWTEHNGCASKRARTYNGQPVVSALALTCSGGMILVDDARWHWRGRLWAHLVSDESYEELHEFAAVLGLPHRGFQGDHYDVPSEYRQRALMLGATPVSSRELVGRLRKAGLRRRPERRS